MTGSGIMRQRLMDIAKEAVMKKGLLLPAASHIRLSKCTLTKEFQKL